MTSEYHRALLASMMNLGWSKGRIAHELDIPLRTVLRLLRGEAKARYPLQCLMESKLPPEIVELHKRRCIEDMLSRRTSYWEQVMERKHGTRS